MKSGENPSVLPKVTTFSTPRTVQSMVTEFHRVMGCVVGKSVDWVMIERRWDLIDEEIRELRAEVMKTSPEDVDLEAVAKELADCVVVLYGSAVEAGIDLDEAVRRVHASNMSKLASDGRPVIHPTSGKVLKGPNYQPPDMTGVVKCSTDG